MEEKNVNMIEQKLMLIEPSMDYQKEFMRFLDDYKSTGEDLIPFVLKYDTSDFHNFIQQFHDYPLGIGIPKPWVPHSTFWLVDMNKNVIGVVNIRHSMNDRLRREGGHIGYGIAPGYRRKGYGALILKLALKKATGFGLKKVLLICDKDNISSSKVIISNNGILESEELLDDKEVQRYWIEIK